MVNYIYIENLPFNLDFQIYLLELSKVDYCGSFNIYFMCGDFSLIYFYVYWCFIFLLTSLANS